MLVFIFIYTLVSVLWLLFFARQRLQLHASVLWIVFAVGILAGPLAGLLSHSLESAIMSPARGQTWSPAALYFGIVGPVEEIVKFGAVILVAFRRRDFGHAADGMLLAVAAALGFACGENILYLLQYGPAATLPRLVLTNLGHPAFSVVWGYALGVVLHEGASFALLVGALLGSALAHGFYDYLLTFGNAGFFLAMVVLVSLIGFMFWFLRVEHARQRSRKKPPH